MVTLVCQSQNAIQQMYKVSSSHFKSIKAFLPCYLTLSKTSSQMVDSTPTRGPDNRAPAATSPVFYSLISGRSSPLVLLSL